MAIVKSELLKQLSKNWPGFLKKDLEKVSSIILNEIKKALKYRHSVELRSFGVFKTRIQKASIRRNPRTGMKVAVVEKRQIHFKMSKDMFKKINNDE